MALQLINRAAKFDPWKWRGWVVVRGNIDPAGFNETDPAHGTRASGFTFTANFLSAISVG